MLGRGRGGGLTDYRSVLGRDGDVEIGAYARRRRIRNLLVAVMGLALIGGAIWLYRALRADDADSTQRDTYAVRVRCTMCQHTWDYQKHRSEDFPFTCPECQLRSGRQLWRCRAPDCEHEFVPAHDEVVVSCPVCTSISVGSAVPDEETDQP